MTREPQHMATMPWPQYAERVKQSVVIVPIGACEQHGHHLPVGTDSFQVMAIVDRVASRTGALVAPIINYGHRSHPRSGGGETFPGTVSLSASTLVAVAREVIFGLMEDEPLGILVADGHWENHHLLHEAILLAIDDCQVRGMRVPKVLLAAFSDFVSEETTRWAFPNGFSGYALQHAGVTETSRLLAAHPELVQTHRMVPQDQAVFPPYDVYPQPADWVPSTGALSDPAEATKEIGEHLIRDSVEGMSDMIEREFPSGKDAEG